uniref:AAA+ ATPase domain-containing protein n=1 Tax=viral metagenome TaxID=1070528 RepID=A0A6C0K2N4_9ZZZZ
MASLIGQQAPWKQCLHLLETSCHIFLTGAAGTGKTTLVKELLKHYATTRKRKNPELWGEESLDECMLLTPDQDRGIQTIRNHVTMFIRQMNPGAFLNDVTTNKIYRWVIIDDVDTFPQISQQALRRPMETYSHITRFIFVGNSIEDLIPALRSRTIHVTMDLLDPYEHQAAFLERVKMPHQELFTEELWSWILNTCQNNVSDFMRLLILVRNILITTNRRPTSGLIQTICSTPFHLDFLPLLNSLAERSLVPGTYQLLEIWKKGYTFEDILESFQTIHRLFGEGSMNENTLVHVFLLNAWIAYCKGNTSVLSLQNIYYKTIQEHPL